MRSKTPLALMEQTVMLLVFALAAALCLQAFAFADRVSQHNTDVDNAVLLAQNTAEVLKASGGVEEAAEVMGGKIRQTLWSTCYDEEGNTVPEGANARYQVDVLPVNSGVEGLGQAHVAVFRSDGAEALFSLTVRWQEVDGDG